MPLRLSDVVHINRIEDLVERVLLILASKSRAVIAVAGVPGAGKSTLAQKLVPLLAQRSVCAKPLPQDGFHYYRKELQQFPDPAEAARRRGAPFTFDVNRFVSTVQQLQNFQDVYAPLFDHALQDPVENDIVIKLEVQVVFVEGNYVGLVESPWSLVSDACDEFWFLDTDPALVRERLIARHLSSGVSASVEEAVERCDSLDRANAVYIRTHLKSPDVIISLR